MRIVSTGLLVAAMATLASCAGNTSAPSDVGSMALPNNGGPGVRTTEPTGRDVGSMAAPSGSGGAVTRTTTSTRSLNDTGSMALPSNSQGNSTPTRR